MSNTHSTSSIVSKVWSFCNTLRDDGVGYGGYLEQLTYLLFLKMADEYSKPFFSRPKSIPKAFQTSLAQAEVLRLSILIRAFEGRLFRNDVHQDSMFPMTMDKSPALLDTARYKTTTLRKSALTVAEGTLQNRDDSCELLDTARYETTTVPKSAVAGNRKSLPETSGIKTRHAEKAAIHEADSGSDNTGNRKSLPETSGIQTRHAEKAAIHEADNGSDNSGNRKSLPETSGIKSVKSLYPSPTFKLL